MTVLTKSTTSCRSTAGTSVALIGRHAIETIDMGGGSAQVNPPYQSSVADGLLALLGDDVTVTDGVEVRNRPVTARSTFVTDPETGEPGTHVWIYAATARCWTQARARSAGAGRLRRRLPGPGRPGADAGQDQRTGSDRIGGGRQGQLAGAQRRGRPEYRSPPPERVSATRCSRRRPSPRSSPRPPPASSRSN